MDETTPSTSAPICRLCGSDRLSRVIDLGRMPVGHCLRFDRDAADPLYPLALDHCGVCGLLQNTNPLPPDVLYAETDTYTTSFQNPAHVGDVLTTLLAYGEADSALDIACNDGFFLRALRDAGFGTVAGLEPNPVAAGLSREQGFAVEQAFLTPDVARRLVAEHGRFGVVSARHVVEHVADLGPFFEALRSLLADDGIVYMELPWIEPGIDCGNPAVVWEEHLSYFAEPDIDVLLQRFGFARFQFRYYAFGGGSLGVFARPAEPGTPDWRERGLGRERILDFAGRIDRFARTLGDLLAAYRDAGWRVALYGAGPRSSTIVNHAGVGPSLDLVIDDREAIQGRFMPGSLTPVVPLAAVDDRPTLMLMGAGSENEKKVRHRLDARLAAPRRHVSLFPPRDAVASMRAALEAL